MFADEPGPDAEFELAVVAVAKGELVVAAIVADAVAAVNIAHQQ